MFAVVIDRDPIHPVVRTQSNETVQLFLDRVRSCYRDPAGKFLTIEGDRVLEIDGVPPRSWTSVRREHYYDGN